MAAKDQELKRGSCVLTEKPFVHILQLNEQEKRCDYCFEEVKVLKCSGCKNVFYCTRKCQMNDWILHKYECKYFQNVAPRKVPDVPRILCRLIIKLHIGGHDEKGYYTENSFRQFKDLISHYDEIKADELRMEELENIKVILNDLINDNLMPNSDELISIYGKFATNSYSIVDDKLHKIGMGIYLGASIIEHSCASNAEMTFEGTTLHIRVTEDIPCLDWTKISISYVDVLKFKDDRRALLKKNYFFLCECSRCLDDEKTNQETAAACPNKNCHQPVNIQDEKCGTCAAEITKDHKEKYHNIVRVTKIELEKTEDMTSKGCICRLGHALAKHTNILHPLNLLHVKSLVAVFNSVIADELWDDAITYEKELIPGIRKYYGDWSQVLALFYMKIARVQVRRKLKQETFSNLLEALKIIKVTYGVEHSLYKKTDLLLRKIVQR